MERKQLPNGSLEMFVVYNHPKDFPDHFVVRRWIGDKPTTDIIIAKSLEIVRAGIPRGLHRLPRQPDEDPVIVETWI